MLTCREVTERSTDFMEGRMSPLGKMSVVAHLALCTACRSYMRQMRSTVALLAELGREPSSEPVPADLMAMFRAWRPPSAAPAAPGRAARLLARLDRLLGGARSYGAALAVVLASGALVGLVRPIPGAAIPLQAGIMCLGMELMAGLLPLGAVMALVWRGRRPITSGVHAFVAGAGALVGQSSLHFTCPEDGLRTHLLAFHLGGVLLAMLLGFAAGRAQQALGRR
jgi:anti-sigma factor RsiW